MRGDAVTGSLRILVVGEDAAVREDLLGTLRSEGHSVTAVTNGLDGLAAMSDESFDIVLADLQMAPESGLDIVRRAAGLRARMASESMRSKRVRPLGSSAAFLEALALARRAATTNVPVFIVGEAGTGKDLFACFIHQESRRSRRPFVEVNCAAVPAPLVDAYLFGQSSATRVGDLGQGMFEAADGGTIFLDEITELPLAVQARMIRVARDGVVQPTTAAESPTVVDVRIISATRRDPEQAANDGQLRRDLMHRLRVISIHLPPLRERREDIPVLAAHFLDLAWARRHAGGAPRPQIEASAIEFLQQQAWRGNVRELQNAMENVALLASPGMVVTADFIAPGRESNGHRGPLEGLWPTLVSETFHAAKERLVARFEQGYLCDLLNRASGNLARAARMASIDRATLYRLIEKHGIAVPREPTRGETPKTVDD